MNKFCVVTGGTKGIGRAIIEKFASQGFDIVTCARNLDDLSLLAKSISKQYAVAVHTCQADMSDKTQVANFAAFVLGLHRPIDVLINNAGYFVPGKVIDEKEGVLESMIDTNLYSAYRITRGLIESMKEKKSGYIFNICSIASIAAYPNGGSYTISKFAMLGFSKVLREELKPWSIRVSSVLPGATFTASWEGVDLPEDRLMKAEDVAEAVYAAYSLSGRSVVEEILIRPMLGDL
jgi:short-subunit dehydrogenase